MAEELQEALKVARMIEADCPTDAAAVDRTPFTPRGVGESFGTTLGLIYGLARVVVVLAEAVTALKADHTVRPS